MADISLTCANCSHVTTVSEFVDESALKCSECGEFIRRPTKTTQEKPKRQISKTGTNFVPEEEPEREDGDKASDLWPGGKHAPRAARRAKVRHHLYGWLLFVVLGCVMGYIRFGDILPNVYLDLLKDYAVWVAVTLHVLTILKAFEDSVFQGILCLLIPFYTIYYVVCVTDSVYFRASVCGLLVGVGWDAGLVLQEQFTTVCETIRAWIARGG